MSDEVATNPETRWSRWNHAKYCALAMAALYGLLGLLNSRINYLYCHIGLKEPVHQWQFILGT